MLSPKQLQSGKCVDFFEPRLAVDGNLRADGNACECVDVAGTVLSTNIGNSKLVTSDNKLKDPVWTLDDFKDPAHMAVERARHTMVQKRPRTSHDGTT